MAPTTKSNTSKPSEQKSHHPPEPTSSQPSSTTSTPPFLYTFTTLIDADHHSIDRLAGRVLHPSHRLSTRLDLFTTLLWRLIRHDISEELVMRPAFATHLGAAGTAAAVQDRRDHAEIKRKLVTLYEGVLAAVQRGDRVDEGGLVAEIKALAAEMAVHMREESGVVLPRFEGVVGREVSSRLGWGYARTLVLTPDMEVCCGGGGGRERCFGQVMDYVRADVADFREILRRLEDEAERGLDGGYLERRVREEMDTLGLVVGSGVEEMRESMGRVKGKM